MQFTGYRFFTRSLKWQGKSMGAGQKFLKSLLAFISGPYCLKHYFFWFRLFERLSPAHGLFQLFIYLAKSLMASFKLVICRTKLHHLTFKKKSSKLEKALVIWVKMVVIRSEEYHITLSKMPNTTVSEG